MGLYSQQENQNSIGIGCLFIDNIRNIRQSFDNEENAEKLTCESNSLHQRVLIVHEPVITSVD